MIRPPRERTTASGSTPTIEYRPTCCASSTDSSKNARPPPRSFRYALTGVSLCLDELTRSLDEGRARVETELALGATRWEAARGPLREAVRRGMIPMINAMSVVGLVSLPGMMTGQILGGTPPEQAARYQVLIIFMIAAATALGAGGAVLLSLRALFDDEHRLRAERLVAREP